MKKAFAILLFAVSAVLALGLVAYTSHPRNKSFIGGALTFLLPASAFLLARRLWRSSGSSQQPEQVSESGGDPASKQGRKLQLFASASVALVAITAAIYYGFRGPESFEDCVLDRMKGQDASLRGIAIQACKHLPRREFLSSKKPKLLQDADVGLGDGSSRAGTEKPTTSAPAISEDFERWRRDDEATK